MSASGPGGVSASVPGGCVSDTPPPSTDRQLLKHNLRKLRLRAVKICVTKSRKIKSLVVFFFNYEFLRCVIFQNGMGFDTGSTHAYVDLGDWSGSTCAVNPTNCEQGIILFILITKIIS